MDIVRLDDTNFNPSNFYLSKFIILKMAEDETCDCLSENQINSHLRFCQVNGL